MIIIIKKSFLSLLIIFSLLSLLNGQICEKPEICERYCWSPDSSCPSPLSYSETNATHFIIHHSGDASVWPEGTDYKQVVRAYWDLHVNTNGWSDIGYNYLIGRDGVIYEGRGDGTMGAHFSCMNSNTIGICIIGNFNLEEPADTAIASLKKLIAWQATNKNISVNEFKYHSNSRLDLWTISGHKDGNDSPNACSSTECPGEYLYTLLPSLRTQIPEEFSCYQISGLSENRLSEAIKIYPNPVKDEIHFAFENQVNIKYIELLSGSGTVLNRIPDSEQTMSMSAYPSGFYLIKVVDKASNIAIFKVTKE